ncbi:MAG: DNA primase [Coriobacteriales bacterium]|nr:DNA primase [Coriobacteriales bacterium]
MITDEDKERVRQATDFQQLVSETVELRQRGSDFWGCCPFHHEKTPSFKINPSTGLWKCFGCGLGGDVFDYVMKRENLEFPDSIRFLADRAGIELVEERGARRGPKRNRLKECMEAAEQYYSTILNRGRGRGPADGRTYLSNRGYGSSVCRKWGLGYAPGHGMLVAHLRSKGFTPEEMTTADLAVLRNNRPADRFYDRVMFPIKDEQGRTIAFGGRVLTDAKPKYLNTKETPIFHKSKHLFGFDKAKEHIVARGEAIVCEGYTDVIALHEAGYPFAVAALGTSFSIDHVKLLARFAKRIICMFDGDAAGQRAADRAIQYLDKSEADLRCVVLPNGQDPAEFLATHRSAELEPILANAQPLMSFVIDNRLAQVSPSSPVGLRVSTLNDLAGVLAPLKDSYAFDAYAREVADRLGFTVEDVKQAIRNRPAHKQAVRSNRPTTPSAGGVAYAQPDVPYGDAYSDAQVPADYLPAEAQEPTGAYYEPVVAKPSTAPMGVSADERMQIRAERELLSLLAAKPDLVKPHANRIATFSWADGRHEAMAWAMLATPDDATPDQLVQAAMAVVDDAAHILASGEVVSTQDMDDAQKVAFVLDVVELYSTRRQIRELRALMRDGSQDASQLFAEATRLQQKSNILAQRLSGTRA